MKGKKAILVAMLAFSLAQTIPLTASASTGGASTSPAATIRYYEIVEKYRTVNGVKFKRRWHKTYGYWIDSSWILASKPYPN